MVLLAAVPMNWIESVAKMLFRRPLPPLKLSHCPTSSRNHSYLCHCPSGITFLKEPRSVLPLAASSAPKETCRSGVVVFSQNPTEPIDANWRFELKSPAVPMPETCRARKLVAPDVLLMINRCDPAPLCASVVTRSALL